MHLRVMALSVISQPGRENDDNVFYILDGCGVFAVCCGFPVCRA